MVLAFSKIFFFMSITSIIIKISQWDVVVVDKKLKSVTLWRWSWYVFTFHLFWLRSFISLSLGDLVFYGVFWCFWLSFLVGWTSFCSTWFCRSLCFFLWYLFVLRGVFLIVLYTWTLTLPLFLGLSILHTYKKKYINGVVVRFKSKGCKNVRRNVSVSIMMGDLYLLSEPFSYIGWLNSLISREWNDWRHKQMQKFVWWVG